MAGSKALKSIVPPFVAALLTGFALFWGAAQAQVSSAQFRTESFMSQVSGYARDRFTTGNQLELLVDGPEFYPARQWMIQTARQTIDLVTFLWCDDSSGLRLARLLAEKARAGVRVRVIIDLYNTKPHEQVYRTLRDSGVELLEYNPVYWGLTRVLEHSLHEKMMIVDGEVALLGSANLCDEYMVGGPRQLWHDLEVKVEGPQVARMQARYDENWNWMARTDLQARFHNSRRLIDPALIPIFRPAGRIYREPTPVVQSEAGSDSSLLVYQRAYRDRSLADDILRLHELLIDLSTTHLQIMTPYLVPPPSFVNALKRAAQRGVRVEIITNSPEKNDVWPAAFAALPKARGLIEAGVHVYEYQPRMLHGKAMLVDGAIISIGSHNFTNRSFTVNGEANLITTAPSITEEFARMVASDLLQCRVLTVPSIISRVRTFSQAGLAIISEFLEEEI